MRHIFHSFLFFLSCINNKLSVEHCQGLEAVLTADEIMHVIGGHTKSRSPGVDGIPSEFYQVFSTLLITDLTDFSSA